MQTGASQYRDEDGSFDEPCRRRSTHHGGADDDSRRDRKTTFGAADATDAVLGFLGLFGRAKARMGKVSRVISVGGFLSGRFGRT